MARVGTPLTLEQATRQAEKDVHAANAEKLKNIRTQSAARKESIYQTHREQQGFDKAETTNEAYRQQLRADRTDEVLRRSDPRPSLDPKDRSR